MTSETHAAAAAAATATAATFPTSKIKAALQAQPDIGMLRQPVVALVGACSAHFIIDLVLQAAKNKTGNGDNDSSSEYDDADKGIVVTLADLQQIIQSSTSPETASGFSLLDGVLDGLEEGIHVGPPPSTASRKTKSTNDGQQALKQPPKKRLKTSVSQNEAVAEALKIAKEAPTMQSTAQKVVVPDEDDYD